MSATEARRGSEDEHQRPKSLKDVKRGKQSVAMPFQDLDRNVTERSKEVKHVENKRKALSTNKQNMVARLRSGSIL
eukprot:5658175-Amphidinium_carterae.1